MLRLFIFILFMYCHTVCAQNIHYNKIGGMNDLAMSLEAMNLPAEDTVFIFDVDGVLTHRSTPIIKEKVQPRGHSTELVKGLHAKGYSLIASSAWNNFFETEHRIRTLGLVECFAMQEGAFDRDFVASFSPTNDIVDHMSEATFRKQRCKLHGEGEKRTVTLHEGCSCDSPLSVYTKATAENGIMYTKNGCIISVAAYLTAQSMGLGQKPLYRQKAMSPMLAYPQKKFKHIVFVDDSSENTNIFKEEIKKLPYAQDAQVYIFELPKIKGVQSLEDKIESFSATCASSASDHPSKKRELETPLLSTPDSSVSDMALDSTSRPFSPASLLTSSNVQDNKRLKRSDSPVLSTSKQDDPILGGSGEGNE